LNNEWIYFATHSDILTTLLSEVEPVDTVLHGAGNLRINSGCKVFTTSVLLQISCTVMSDVTLKGADLLTQNCSQQDCCLGLGLKLNISQLCVDVKGKQTDS